MICPVCRKETVNGMSVNFLDKLNWVRCSCGVVFQENENKKELSEDYLKTYKDKKFFEASAQYPVMTYFPVIEDLTYGRMMLEVDSLDFEACNAAARRGWVTYATGKGECKGTHIYPEAFEKIEDCPDPKFDLIYAYHLIEKKPELLEKFKDWLNPGGILFLATPDTQFIDELGVMNFGHWFAENALFYSKPMIVLELEKNNFEVVMVRANSSARFVKANDMHIIARRKM